MAELEMKSLQSQHSDQTNVREIEDNNRGRNRSRQSSSNVVVDNEDINRIDNIEAGDRLLNNRDNKRNPDNKVSQNDGENKPNIKRKICVFRMLYVVVGVIIAFLLLSAVVIWEYFEIENLKQAHDTKDRKEDQSKVLHMELGSSNNTVSIENQTEPILKGWKITSGTHGEDITFAVLAENGTVVIKSAGEYLIYCTITFMDDRQKWSFGVFIDEEKFIACTWSDRRDNIDNVETPHSCHLSGVHILDYLQRVTIRQGYITNIFKLGTLSFWGIVKLS